MSNTQPTPEQPIGGDPLSTIEPPVVPSSPTLPPNVAQQVTSYPEPAQPIIGSPVAGAPTLQAPGYPQPEVGYPAPAMATPPQFSQGNYPQTVDTGTTPVVLGWFAVGSFALSIITFQFYLSIIAIVLGAIAVSKAKKLNPSYSPEAAKVASNQRTGIITGRIGLWGGVAVMALSALAILTVMFFAIVMGVSYEGSNFSEMATEMSSIPLM